MDLILPNTIANGYSSPTQKIRVMTEYWVENSLFCPSCGRTLSHFENNMPVADFFCKGCNEEFELKSKNGKVGNKLVDGAYHKMIQRLTSNNNPNLFLLSYEKLSLRIVNFLAIPKNFFIKNIIEERRALRSTARRAGWIGCNILLSSIPEIGKIYYIRSGKIYEKKDVLDRWNNTEFIKDARSIDARGWLLDVLLCVEKIKKDDFSLGEVYNFESYLQTKHPLNNNVKAKIRQQLQFLRDKNVLEFLGNGKYHLKVR